MRNDRQEFSKRRAKRTKSQRVCGGGLGWVHAKFLHLTHFRYNRASLSRKISTEVFKVIRNPFHLGLLYCTSPLVQKTPTTSSTDQIQN